MLNDGVRRIRVAAAVIISNGKVLLASRPENKPPAGWEFPGGKLEPGESPQQAAERELLEELDFPVLALDEIYRLVLYPPATRLELHFIRALPAGNTGRLRPLEGQRFLWVPLHGGRPAELLEADAEVWDFIAGV